MAALELGIRPDIDHQRLIADPAGCSARLFISASQDKCNQQHCRENDSQLPLHFELLNPPVSVGFRFTDKSVVTPHPVRGQIPDPPNFSPNRTVLLQNQ